MQEYPGRRLRAWPDLLLQWRSGACLRRRGLDRCADNVGATAVGRRDHPPRRVHRFFARRLLHGFDQVSTRDDKGNRLPQTAKFTSNVTADYEIPVSIGKLNLTASYSFNSGYYSEVNNNLHQSSFGLLNGSIGFTLQGGLGVRGWVRNLTDKKVTNSMNTTNVGTTTTYQPPRTYGLAVTASF